jgi:hypothetical protein
MNTWMTELIYGANERFFSRDELERMKAYFGSMPARLRAAEELERLESTLAEHCRSEWHNQAPACTPSPMLLRDQIESLRLVAQAMLLDDPRLLQSRLLDHLGNLTHNLSGADRELQAGYQTLGAVLRRQLSPTSLGLLEPYLERILETVSDAAPKAGSEGRLP